MNLPYGNAEPLKDTEEFVMQPKLVEHELLEALTQEAYQSRTQKNELARIDKKATDTIKSMIADFGEGPLQVGSLVLVPEARAGKINIPDYQQRLIDAGVDPKLVHDEAERAVNPPSVALKIVPVQDLEVR
jgi:hypothetical protein